MSALICLQIFFWGYLICSCGSVTLSVEGIHNDEWVFKDQSTVTLVCKIPNYTGSMVWQFNSLRVAYCTPADCLQTSTGDGDFSFGFDLRNYVFTWTISPVNIKKHNEKLIECFDGNNDSRVIILNITEADESPNTISHKDMQLATLIQTSVVIVEIVVATTAVGVWIKRSILEIHLNKYKETCTVDTEIPDVKNNFTNAESLLEKLNHIEKSIKQDRNEENVTDENPITSSLDSVLCKLKSIEINLQRVENKIDGPEEKTRLELTVESLLKKINKMEEKLNHCQLKMDDTGDKTRVESPVDSLFDKMNNLESILEQVWGSLGRTKDSKRKVLDSILDRLNKIETTLHHVYANDDDTGNKTKIKSAVDTLQIDKEEHAGDRTRMTTTNNAKNTSQQVQKKDNEAGERNRNGPNPHDRKLITTNALERC